MKQTNTCDYATSPPTCTFISSPSVLAVDHGGTGISSIPSGSVGNVIVSNGSAWVQAPIAPTGDYYVNRRDGNDANTCRDAAHPCKHESEIDARFDHRNVTIHVVNEPDIPWFVEFAMGSLLVAMCSLLLILVGHALYFFEKWLREKYL